MNHIVSFSGGKDSTAMLLKMIDHGEDIHSVVFFDTGWEFPEMIKHVNKVEKYTGIDIVRLESAKSFDYLLSETPVKKKGTTEIHRFGHGWPAPMRRWCTRRAEN